MPSVKVFVCRCFIDEDLPDLPKRCNFVFWESYQSQFKNPWASLSSKIVGPSLSTYSARGCRSVSTAKSCGWCNMDFFRTIIWDGKAVNLSILRSLSRIQKSSTRNRPFFSCRFPSMDSMDSMGSLDSRSPWVLPPKCAPLVIGSTTKPSGAGNGWRPSDGSSETPKRWKICKEKLGAEWTRKSGCSSGRISDLVFSFVGFVCVFPCCC